MIHIRVVAVTSVSLNAETEQGGKFKYTTRFGRVQQVSWLVEFW